MADDAPQQQSSEAVTTLNSLEYWCYHCEERVSVETLTDISDVICHECKSGFVESIAPAPAPAPFSISDLIDQPFLDEGVLQVLRLMTQMALDIVYDAPPSPPPSNPADLVDNSEDDDDGQEEDGSEEESEDQVVREANLIFGRLRDFALQATNRRDRIRCWNEILMRIENQTIQLPLQFPEMDDYEMDDYVGNPEAGLEALLQNLADVDGGGRKGAPPASKSAILALQMIEITSQSEDVVCAICKDLVTVGEIGKKLPCAHVYHEDCIIPWLGSRNSCPVCRYELETDDLEYEEERKKKKQPITNACSEVGPSNSG